MMREDVPGDLVGDLARLDVEWHVQWGAYIAALRADDDLAVRQIALAMAKWHDANGWPWPDWLQRRIEYLERGTAGATALTPSGTARAATRSSGSCSARPNNLAPCYTRSALGGVPAT